MSRNSSIATQSLARRRVLFNRNIAQKILLTLLLTGLAAIPLWLGLEHAHSAPVKTVSPLAAPTPMAGPTDLRADFVTAEFGAGVKSHFFKSALQLITTASDEVASAMRLMKRKRCPSVDTS